VRGIENIPWLFDACCALAELGGLSRWRDWLAAGARGRTLEVGCGTGRNLPRYAGELRPVAVEPDASMIRRARRRAARALLVRASAEALPFRDGAFDTVVASLVFCSVPDAARGLAEVRRVLEARGRLRMVEHVRSTSPWRARLQDLVQPCWTWLAGGCHPNRRTEEAVERAGFVIETEGRRARGTMRRFSARRAAPA
jgi:ubiquinone/menaquinone biosynthesis C-methylase UbiE